MSWIPAGFRKIKDLGGQRLRFFREKQKGTFEPLGLAANIAEGVGYSYKTRGCWMGEQL